MQVLTDEKASPCRLGIYSGMVRPLARSLASVLLLSCLAFSWSSPRASGRILDYPFHRGTIFECLACLYVRDEIIGDRFGCSDILGRCEFEIYVVAVVLLDLHNLWVHVRKSDVVALHDVAK